ncbi:hypothetical protein SK128_000101 [Halocaridina rubra]|uniref:Uncharacterized protein n=1 Tax=Halocaridina rubra TaxID=373956 RepID=A0AAN8ZX87_HALRR
MTWKINGKERVYIPMSRIQEEHNLQLFSTNPTKPEIYLDMQKEIQLGWYDGSLKDFSENKDQELVPIEDQVLYNLTVTCKKTSKISCDIQAKPSNKTIKTYSLDELPRDISFAGASEDLYFVFYCCTTSTDADLPINNRSQITDSDTAHSVAGMGNCIRLKLMNDENNFLEHNGKISIE